MIAEFRVKNFLSIKTEQCLSFDVTPDTLMKEEYSIEVKEGVRLLKLALIYGANASGKTNILLALSFFQKIMNDIPKDKTEKLNTIPFLLDNSSRKEPSDFFISFYLNHERYELSLKVDNYRIYKETLVCYPGTQPATLYSRTYNDQSDSTEINFGKKLGLSKKSQMIIIGNTINNCSVLAAFGKSNIETTRLNVVYDFFSQHMSEILRPTTSLSPYIKRNLDEDQDNEMKEFLINILKASDFNISGVMLKEEEEIITPEMEKLIESAPIPNEAKQEMFKKGKITNYELLFKHNTDNGEFELSEDLESRGTIRFMGMAVILKKILFENNIVPIDEIETSLHYELLSYFIKVFLANSDKNSQLIMTTHDINLLDENFIRRDSVWFTDKDNYGETHLIRLSSMGLHKNLSPYNAYMQGKLVKLPFLGSIYLKDNNLCEEK
ncbi:MAG: ATP-binding protein [Paludibacter sp.]